MTLRTLPKADIASRPGLRSDVTPKSLSRWNPDVRAAADETEATISILDPIGMDYWGDGVTAKRITAALRSIGDRDAVVNVNSPGGDFFEGLAIYNALREHKAKVTVNILGVAASAASVIAMAGDEIRIARAGFLMIHNTWVVAAGDRNAFIEVADWLAPFDDVSADIYAARTGIAKDKIAAMLDRETWISGSAAVEQGFADGLLSADEIDAGSDAQQSGGSARAEKRFDVLAHKGGMSRVEARQLLTDLKGGKPGAASDITPGADVAQGLRSFLESLKSI
ncbi:head maturation protease, ClpP-related [Falsirhodobacter halotolerans]|uniref:head maturation protease, ClpP-related n=1 Tax=Falsirhodobacter halotolerans TaxID=1146892 RepID=UPI001FD59C0D|nr:head maturation protease, ClpP-related [Falsirhodobacter halotolerans]MCJ8138425.1 Clp protease ClpP [Falsirhodobacter halotolerans]